MQFISYNLFKTFYSSFFILLKKTNSSPNIYLMSLYDFLKDMIASFWCKGSPCALITIIRQPIC